LELVEMFLKTSYKTILGQSLDTRFGLDKCYNQ